MLFVELLAQEAGTHALLDIGNLLVFIDITHVEDSAFGWPFGVVRLIYWISVSLHYLLLH